MQPTTYNGAIPDRVLEPDDDSLCRRGKARRTIVGDEDRRSEEKDKRTIKVNNEGIRCHVLNFSTSGKTLSVKIQKSVDKGIPVQECPVPRRCIP
jgi:hypothetical protein